MQRFVKRLFSVLLALVLMLGLLSAGAAAVSVPTTAGLYFRTAQSHYDENTGEYVFTVEDSEYLSETVGVAGLWFGTVGQFVYVDGNGNERIVAPTELTVPDGAGVSEYSGTDFVFVDFALTGAYVISYSDLGSVVFQAQLPTVGFYSTASAAEDTLLFRWDYNGTNDTVFFAVHDDEWQSYTLTAVSEEGNHTEITLAADGKSASIRLTDPKVSYLTLRYSYTAETASGESNSFNGMILLTVRDLLPGLGGRRWFQQNSTLVTSSYVNKNTWFMDPRDQTVQFVYTENGVETPVALEDLVFPSGITATATYPEDHTYLTLSYADFGDYVVYYPAKDASLLLSVGLPTVGYYSTPEARKDSYLWNVWNYTGENDTIYFAVLNTDYKLKNASAVNDDNAVVTLSEDRSYVTICVTEPQADYFILHYDVEYTITGTTDQDINYGIRINDLRPPRYVNGTIQLDAALNGETITLTVTGVQDRFTNFDIMTLFGSSGGPYSYALWFDADGTFSFDKDVTLVKSEFDANFNQIDHYFEAKAGVVYSIADGVDGGSWSEYGITMDDGNALLIIDSRDPANYQGVPARTPLSQFPGTVVLSGDETEGPIIIRQPVDYVGAEGSIATFTVVAEGEGPLTYQWWIRNPGENEFAKSTRKTATYSTTLKAASNGRELYCVVTDAGGNSVTSDTVTMTIEPTLTITQQPVDYVGAEGSTASFTVVAEGKGPLSYQWWIRNPGENEFAKSTRKTATYSTTLKAASNGRELYCVVTDASGKSVTSDTVTMTIESVLAITRQPVNYVGAEGSTASFTVVADGKAPLTYQWWIRNPGENEFTKSTRKTATYSTTLKAASNGRELYCVVTDANGNTVTSDTVTMTIEPAALAIVQQPVDYVGAEGSTASFTVVAEGEGLTYQWWIRNPGENEFTKSTRKTATYSTTLKAASSGRELYCVVTDASGNSVTSDVVTMTIEPAALAIVQQPVDYVGAEGSTASFTVVAEGEGLTYQWWIRNPGENEFTKSTRRSATYSTTLKAASSGRELYCVVTDANGNSVQTDTVTMTIEPTALTITQQPVDYVGAEGSTASFTVVAEGEGLTYQWWIRNPGENEFTKSTRKAATYSTTLKAASSGRELYCVVTDASGNSVTSDTVTMSIG